jgi:hypothetical protein
VVSRKNYAFERNQRAKAKAAKRQAKLAEKAARSRASPGPAVSDVPGEDASRDRAAVGGASEGGGA